MARQTYFEVRVCSVAVKVKLLDWAKIPQVHAHFWHRRRPAPGHLMPFVDLRKVPSVALRVPQSIQARCGCSIQRTTSNDVCMI